MSKAKAILLGAAMSVIAGWAVADGNETSALSAPFTHERHAALAADAWGGMRADWSAVELHDTFLWKGVPRGKRPEAH